MISDERPIPLSWYVTKVEDTFPLGLCKIILKQDFFDPQRDNPELMIADYYKDKVSLNNIPADPDIHTSHITAHINISSWKSPKIIIGSTYSEMLGEFYHGSDLIEQAGQWNIQIPDDIQDKFQIETKDNKLRIKCDKDYSLVGKVIIITFSDVNNRWKATQEIEVAAR